MFSIIPLSFYAPFPGIARYCYRRGKKQLLCKCSHFLPNTALARVQPDLRMKIRPIADPVELKKKLNPVHLYSKVTVIIKDPTTAQMLRRTIL